MLMNMNQIYETFGRKVGDFVYRTFFKRRTFKDSKGYFREIVSVSQDDDHDYYKVSEAFTKDDLTEYNILKNVRDRFLWYRREGSTDSDAIRKTAEELRIPVEQVEMELEYYGLAPNVGRAGEVPAETPKSPVTVTNPGYRTHDLPVITRSESKRKGEKNMKRKRKPQKMEEMISFDDGEEAIEDFADKIENAGIDWYGTDASLAISMGEYIAFIPNVMRSTGVLIKGYDYEYLSYIYASKEDIKETIEDAIEMNGEEIASFMGTTVDELDRELEFADTYDLLHLVNTVEMYSGLFFEDESPVDAIEVVMDLEDTFRKRGMIEKDEKTKTLSKKRKMNESHSEDIAEYLETIFLKEKEKGVSYIATDIARGILSAAFNLTLITFSDPEDLVEQIVEVLEEDTFRKRGMIEKDEKTKTLSKKRKMKEITIKQESRDSDIVTRKVNNLTDWKVFDYAVEVDKDEFFFAYSEELRQIYSIIVSRPDEEPEIELMKDNASLDEWKLTLKLTYALF